MLEVSIHTLHELEARKKDKELKRKDKTVSIHTLHELEARLFVFLSVSCFLFPFIRFTNWKQVVGRFWQCQRRQCVSIHTLHELEARSEGYRYFKAPEVFPFIRFTNWKQGGRSDVMANGTRFPFIRFTNWKQVLRWFYVGREWSNGRVSIHTLHELEARKAKDKKSYVAIQFPFIRFTNWKQGVQGLPYIRIRGRAVSIHTLHELEASVRRVNDCHHCERFPFIRFTNWKQVHCGTSLFVLPSVVSIHTLHELEARLALQS